LNNPLNPHHLLNPHQIQHKLHRQQPLPLSLLHPVMLPAATTLSVTTIATSAQLHRQQTGTGFAAAVADTETITPGLPAGQHPRAQSAGMEAIR